MKRLRQITVLVLLATAGFCIWYYFFPDPERAIRKELEGLAAAINKEPSGNISRVANANSIAGHFTPDVSISTEGRYSQNIQGRAELEQMVMAARTNVRRVKVTFTDIHVMLEAGNTAARVFLTALVKVDNDSETYVQDVKLLMRKVDRDWLISHIEPAKQLKPE